MFFKNKKVATSHYIIWVTCLLPEYESRILNGMTKKGYSVGQASPDNPICLQRETDLAALLFFKASINRPNISVSAVLRDLLDVLQEENIYYFSTVVNELYELTTCSWSSSNIQIPKKTSSHTPPISEADKKLN